MGAYYAAWLASLSHKTLNHARINKLESSFGLSKRGFFVPDFLRSMGVVKRDTSDYYEGQVGQQITIDRLSDRLDRIERCLELT